MATHFVNGVKLKIVPVSTVSFMDAMTAALLRLVPHLRAIDQWYRLRGKTNDKISAISEITLFGAKRF